MANATENSRHQKRTQTLSHSVKKGPKRTIHGNAPAQPERDVDSRDGARAMGFNDIPGSNTEVDSRQDLNERTFRAADDESVDSLSGSDSGNDASLFSDYDTITDSNTLTSPSTIAGAYFLQNTPHRKEGQRREDLESPESLQVRAKLESNRNQEPWGDRQDEHIREASDSELGLTEVSDEETVRGYEEAEKNDRRAGASGKARNSRKEGSHRLH